MMANLKYHRRPCVQYATQTRKEVDVVVVSIEGYTMPLGNRCTNDALATSTDTQCYWEGDALTMCWNDGCALDK